MQDGYEQNRNEFGCSQPKQSCFVSFCLFFEAHVPLVRDFVVLSSVKLYLKGLCDGAELAGRWIDIFFADWFDNLLHHFNAANDVDHAVVEITEVQVVERAFLNIHTAVHVDLFVCSKCLVGCWRDH